MLKQAVVLVVLGLLCFVKKSLNVRPTSPLTTSRTLYSSETQEPEHGKCETIKVTFCVTPNYNKTIMPNSLNHANQEEASLAMQQLHFLALSKSNCSQDLQLFLCLVYIPVCTVLDQIVPPCRSLCLSVKNGCYGYMRQLNLNWPDELDCDRFPEVHQIGSQICFGKNETYLNTTISEFRNRQKYDPLFAANKKNSPTNPSARNFGFVCPLEFQAPENYDYSLKVLNKVERNCGAPCRNMFFDESERNIARIWIVIWASFCCLSCIFTVLTFLIDTKRFRYPERPIIFISICYLMISLMYIYGFFSGDEIACSGPFKNSTYSIQSVSVISQGTKNEACTIVFMILYFFGMSSSIWWVILTLTWYLASGLKWGHEAIESNSHYFHLAAWAVPSIKTVMILSMGKIEGDVLSGVCYVGMWNVDVLTTFVLIPFIVYFVLGTIFLLAGFISLFRIRTVMKHDGTQTDKLEKLMFRILIFSSVYTIPAVVILGCLVYEQVFFFQFDFLRNGNLDVGIKLVDASRRFQLRFPNIVVLTISMNFDSWMLTWQAKLCKERMYSVPCPIDNNNRNIGSKPIFKVFMMKYLMYLIVGVTSTVWIWSGKTICSWKKFYNRCFKREQEEFV